MAHTQERHKMNDFNKLLQTINPEEEQFNPRNYVEEPIQPVMPDSLVQKAQEEAVTQELPPLESFTTPDIAPPAPNMGRNPAVEPPPAKKDNIPETPEGRLERLMKDLNTQRGAEREDAESRKFKADLFKILEESAGGIIGGAQAMNTKAAINIPKTTGFDVGDLVGQVDKRFEGDRKALLDQYKSLKDGGLSAKDEAYLAMQEKQYQLGLRRANDSMDRFGQGENRRVKQFDENMREKQELSPAQMKEVKDIEVSIDSLDKLEGMKNFSTGPIAGRLEKAKRYIGASPANKATLFSQLQMVTSQYGKAISGSAIAEPEFIRIQSQLPNENDPDDVFAAKLINFKEGLEDSHLRILDSYEKAGRDTTSLKNRKPIEQLRAEKSGNVNPKLEENAKKYSELHGISIDQSRSIMKTRMGL